MNKFLGGIVLIASLGGFLFGFDMAVVSGVIPLITVSFQLSAAAQGWFVSSALLGCIAGVAFSGSLSDQYGRKKILLLAALLFFMAALGCGLLPAYSMIILARIAGGVGVGIASNVVPLYIAEVAPASIRGRMVTFYQLAITVGILLAYCSNAFILSRVNQAFFLHPWQLMFLVGSLPALVFLLGVLLIPESPRWLMQQGRIAEGGRIFAQLGMSDREEISRQESMSFGVLFSRPYRKALLLGLLLPLFSQLSGINAIIYFGPSILLQSGASITDSYGAQIFFGVANVLFTLIAIWKVDQLGRRPLYLIGSAGAVLCLSLTGFAFGMGGEKYGLMIGAIFGFLLFFAFSIGPLKFVVASEIFPGAIRGRALALSIMVMWIADTIVGQLTPLLLTYLGADYTFYFFAVCCAVAFVTVLKLLPETKGKSLEEIEHLWKK